MSGFSDKATNALRESSTLSDFVGSIDGHISATEDILARVTKMADHIGGPIPRDAVSTSPDTPPEPGVNLRLQRKLARLGQLQAAISGELARLENSL